jgi:hypothetical protein
MKTEAKTVMVELPTGPGLVADFLYACGHTKAAQAVRGYVLRWVDVA